MTTDQNDRAIFEKAKDYALNFLTYRLRTEKEMKRKMTEKGYDSEMIALVVDFLKEYKFLDDNSFARMWINDRICCKPTGRRKIYYELIEKGVSKEIIEKNLVDMTPDLEYKLMKELLNKKVSKCGFNYKKFEGFFMRKGFNPSVVRKLLNECELEENNT